MFTLRYAGLFVYVAVELRRPFYDAYVSFGPIAQRFQSRLVARTVMGCYGLFDAVKLNQYRTLFKTSFVNL
jgi:hypothetical protein